MFIQMSWKGKLEYQAWTESGHQILLDAKPEAGGEDKGPSPMELLLVALAGCTAMDVVIILKKKKADLHSLTIKVEGERAAQPPKYFTRIDIAYNFEGKNLKEEDIKQSIKLSKDKYCSVYAMIKERTEITFRWDIMNK